MLYVQTFMCYKISNFSTLSEKKYKLLSIYCKPLKVLLEVNIEKLFCLNQKKCLFLHMNNYKHN